MLNESGTLENCYLKYFLKENFFEDDYFCFFLVTHLFFLSIFHTHRFFFKHTFSSHHSNYSLYTHGSCTPHKLRVVCPFHDGSFFPFMCIHTRIIHFLFHRIIFIPERNVSGSRFICMSIFSQMESLGQL